MATQYGAGPVPWRYGPQIGLGTCPAAPPTSRASGWGGWARDRPVPYTGPNRVPYNTEHVAMAMAEVVLAGSEEEIRWRVVHRGDSLRSVSRHLQGLFPGIRGLSVKSVRRFCSSRGIHYKSNIGDRELDEFVRLRVRNVGHSYGRRSLQGLLGAEGIRVSQRRLGRSLRRTFPLAHSVRTQTLGRWIIPIPYRAEFYGEKIHFDQNEKLVMYGAVHVVAVDGYSRKIVVFRTMPRKNPITIYCTIFRPLLLHDGIWNQLRSDHGTEFVLIATLQQFLAHLRVNQQRLFVLQTTSRQNH